MLSDARRMNAYAEALRRAVKPGCVVLDIGTGTGVFAFLACQLGARRVFAIEPSDAIQIARAVAKDNGYHQIEFIQALSQTVTLPEAADVIVSDLRGALPLFHNHISTIVDARKRLLAPTGVFIPAADTLWAAPVEIAEWYDRHIGLDFDGRPVDAVDIERMNAALAAHGPDDRQSWTGGPLGLAYGLMRFTPEDRCERQPLVSSDGNRILVCDARIDNRPELMRALDLPGDASQWPDSAFILRAYEKWGSGCAAQLIGAFAFALWNAGKQRLLLVRSAGGERVLFYHRSSQCFAFATMPKGLLALPCVPRAINEERLADFLVLNGSNLQATMYRGIERLLPGHSLTVDRDGVRLHRFWQLDLNRQIRLPRDDDYVDAFRELFDRVVSDHLRSATPVGALMSGGLDSSAVATTAARRLKREGQRLATFTEVPHKGFAGPVMGGRYADESPFVEAIAKCHDNLDLNFVRTEYDSIQGDVDLYFAHAETPFPNPTNRLWWEAIHQQASQKGVRVVLTGETGNVTISWNGSGLMPALVQRGRWVRAWRESRGLAARGESRAAWRSFLGRGVLPLLPSPFWLAIQRWSQHTESASANPWQAYSPINPQFALQHQVAARGADSGHDFQLIPKLTRKLRSLLLIPPEKGELPTAYRAMYGVDSRDPTGDIRIVEFCFGVPEEQYLRDGRPRWLVRRAMADRVPPEVLWNRKRGLQGADWVERAAAMRPQIEQQLIEFQKSDLASRALDLPRLRRLVTDWPEERADSLEGLLSFQSVLARGLMVGRFILWFEAGG